VRKAFIIARKDMKEALRSRSTYFYILFLFLLSFPYFDGSRTVIRRLTEQGLGPAELQAASQSFLTTVVYTLPLVLIMLFCSFLSAYAVIMDKAKRTLESLLATPASLRQIWLGKSLAVALPSIVITLLVLLIAVIVVNQVFVVPTLGVFLVPSALSLVAALIIIPVMTFFVVCIVSFLQLIMTNPRIANFAFIAVFLVIYLTTITELSASWDFSLIYLIVTILLAAVTFVLGRFLSKEKVVLSSKG
jgi:ABC-2 type transport system permease protein